MSEEKFGEYTLGMTDCFRKTTLLHLVDAGQERQTVRYENVFSITNRQVILEIMNLCLK